MNYINKKYVLCVILLSSVLFSTYRFVLKSPKIEVKLEDPFVVFNEEKISDIKSRYNWEESRIDKGNGYWRKVEADLKSKGRLPKINADIEIYISNRGNSNENIRYSIYTKLESCRKIYDIWKDYAIENYGYPDDNLSEKEEIKRNGNTEIIEGDFTKWGSFESDGTLIVLSKGKSEDSGYECKVYISQER